MAINVFTTVNQYYTHCLTSITHNFSLEERTYLFGREMITVAKLHFFR